MRSTKVWKSLAGVTATVGLLLAGTGVATAAAPRPAQDQSGPGFDCASFEHVGLGMVVNCSKAH